MTTYSTKPLILYGLLLMAFLAVPLIGRAASHPVQPPPPVGGGGWGVKAQVVCAAPSSSQPACYFSGTVTEIGDSTAALVASHNGILKDVAASLSAVFTGTNVAMDDGNYSGQASIYDIDKNLVAVKKVQFYVAGNVAYLANPSVVSSWLSAHSAPGDTYKATADIPFHVINATAESGKVVVTASVANQPVAVATSKFGISGPND